ncbi:MAG: hypothetical protein GX184_00140 [Clostridiaceae bacterium]|nr:hypothetical protein [Clostridiaceae bacterium]
MPQLRMIFMILAIGLLVSVLQVVIWRVSGRHSFYKYIPVLVLLIIGIACIIKAVFFSTGMEDLAYFVTATMVLGVMFVSLLTAVIIDLITKFKK